LKKWLSFEKKTKMTNLDQKDVMNVLAAVQHPELNGNIVDLEMLDNVKIDGNKLSLDLHLLTPADPHRHKISEEIKKTLESLDGISDAAIHIIAAVPNDGRPRDGLASGIRNIIAIASGKGGVGKSTIAVNIAIALAQSGARIGLLDSDVYGPNVPRMMGVDRLPAPPGKDGKLIPAEAFGVKLMSMGFLVKPEQAMVWRGPMLHNAIRQFVQDVEWGELDYLIVDMPPGTGDVQLSLAQTTAISGGVIVTLPQEVSVDDARRGMEMFKQMRIDVLGVIENMSYLEVGDGDKIEVFGSGGGESLASEMNVPFLGKIPMDPKVREGGDNGKAIVVSDPESKTAKVIVAIAEELALRVAIAAKTSQKQAIPITMVEE
jgi:ATP-binding protein involved in chromosome partitioning